MIEQGLVQLVNASAAVTSIAAAGGYYVELPKDATLPSWSYLFVSDIPDQTLQGSEKLTNSRVQVDCYGAAPADAINLAHAIDAVLSGYAGVLSDPDSTRIQGCFRINKLDFFDDASRTYRRMLEYRIWYVAN